MNPNLKAAPLAENDSGLVVALDKGIPGFPELSSLTIRAIDPDSMFVWLSAVERAEVAFLALNPFFHFPDYDVELSALEEGSLAVAPGDELIVYCLVTLEREAGIATVNLLAPLVINMTRQIAQQVILEGEHELRARIPVPAMASSV